MKKLIPLLIITVFFCFIGCGSDPILPPQHNVIINHKWSENPVTGPISLAEVKAYTNQCDIYFKDVNDGSITPFINLSDFGCSWLNISAGTYDILILGGYRQKGLLLASSFILGKTIVPGELNEFDMIFETFEATIDGPDVVTVGETFSVSAKINTKNPMILVDNGEPYYSQTWYNNGSISCSSYGTTAAYFRFTDFTRDGNVWKFFDPGNNITAPNTSTPFTCYFNMTYKPFNDIQNSMWILASTSSSPFMDYFIKTIPIVIAE